MFSSFKVFRVRPLSQKIWITPPIRLHSTNIPKHPIRLTNRPSSKQSIINNINNNNTNKRLKFWHKLAIGIIGSTSLIYLGDSYLGHGIIKRNFKSIYTLIALSIDYKLHFNENYDVDILHERNAQRLYDLIIENKGLYIKLGQMIAVQGVMFPKHYQDKFKLLFDKAPIESWEICDITLKKELGENYKDEIFIEIDKIPIASASIAQVHKAILKNGDKVAVKIQKNSVSRQLESDLFTYKYIMYFYGWLFEMPLEKTINYVCEKMREELNFKNEYKNAIMITNLIKNDYEFKNSNEFYIPKYYNKISSTKILISEWMDAKLIGEYEGLSNYGFDLSKIMLQITKIYARQVFTWGVVHCDLHPGNLMVRNINITNKNWLTKFFFKEKKIQQLIILDHGLYEHFSSNFKKQYSEFWKYSMEKDYNKTKDVLSSWGMEADEMIMTLAGLGDKNSESMKIYISKMKNMTYFEKQLLLKQKMKDFFSNTDKFPLCLVFVMRSMRIVQGLNRNFGAPVNRLAILVDEANKSVEQFLIQTGEFDSWRNYLTRKYVTLTLKVITNVMFQLNKSYIWLCSKISDMRIQNLEDVYDDEVVMAGELFGFESVPSSKELIV
jgi:aarF domain-containing kinase